MRFQHYQLAAIVMAFAFQGLAHAQPQPKPKVTYVEIDDIFAQAASQKVSTGLTVQDSQKFGRTMESRVGMRGNAESKAAGLLLEFEKDPNADEVVKASAASELKGERKLVRADILLAAFTLKLIQANRTPVGENDSDFLADYVRKQLRDLNVQRDLLIYTDKEIGLAPERAIKTLELLATLQISLSVEKQSQIIVAVRTGNKTALLALNLPPPACIIFRSCG